MNASTTMLGSVLASFFNDHLKLQKGLRPNSITSYADAMRLFLQFAAKTAGKKITQLGLDDLDADARVQLLKLSRRETASNAAQSRNQRLAALRTFFEYVGRRFPERLGQAQKVASIPRKRAQPPETVFLERDEIEVDPGRTACRRAPCSAGPRPCWYSFTTREPVSRKRRTSASSDVHFDPTPRVHLHGKGDKWRVCPLWAETSALLKRLYLRRDQDGRPDRPVFIGARDAALTRFGIYKIIRRYTTHVVKQGSDGQSKADLTSRLAPHHRRASSRGRRRGECHSRMARPRELGDHQSLR